MAQGNRNTVRKKDEELSALSAGSVPPQALDIEKSVIGSMMIDSNCLTEIVGSLNERCFYDPRIRSVFRAITELYNSRCPVDLLSVCEQMKIDGSLEAVGGPAFIAELTASVATSAHAEYHALILQQKAIQRNLIEASYSILRDAFDETVAVGDLVDSATKRVYDAVQINMTSTYKHVGDVANRSMNMISRIQAEGVMPGVPTGFRQLDSLTSGWQPSNLIIIGARPSMGKTAFALNLASAAAIRFKVPTAFFTLEMHDTELTDRMLSSETGIQSDKIKGKDGYKLTPEEWERLEMGLGTITKAPLYIDETPGLSITDFVTKARKMQHDHNIGLIIIDYLQLMQGTGAQSEFREQVVSSISRALKATAKELNIPIIALSQLNRSLANRPGTNGRPMLSDLRESGAIEQDADIVMFVHRPAALGMSDNQKEAEIIVAKNRSGKIGTVELSFNGDYFRFEEPDTLSQKFESTMNRTSEEASYNPFDRGSSDFSPTDWG